VSTVCVESRVVVSVCLIVQRDLNGRGMQMRCEISENSPAICSFWLTNGGTF
jgi:hypothetical protein